MKMTKEEHLEVIHKVIEAAHAKMKEVGYGNPGWEYKVAYVQGLIKAYENTGILDEIEPSNLKNMLASKII